LRFRLPSEQHDNGDTAGNPCADGTLPTLSNGAYCERRRATIRSTTSPRPTERHHFASRRTIHRRRDFDAVGAKLIRPRDLRDAGVTINSRPTRWIRRGRSGSRTTRLMELTPTSRPRGPPRSRTSASWKMFSNNNVCSDSTCCSVRRYGRRRRPTSTMRSSDINNTMPTPANGTNQPAATPQAGAVLRHRRRVEDETRRAQCTQPLDATVARRDQSGVVPLRSRPKA